MSTLVVAVLCAFSGCAQPVSGAPDESPSADSGPEDSGPSEIHEIGTDTYQDVNAGTDADALLSDAIDASDADMDEGLLEDAPAEETGPVDTGPPPLDAAPAWFYQTKLEAVQTDENGESEQLLIDLPEGTTSVFLQVEAEEDYAFFTLKTVVTPKPLSQIIVKGAGDATCIPCLNRVTAAQKVAAFLIPNDPNIEVKGGEWLFRLRATGILKTAGDVISYPPVSATSSVTILARTEPVPEVGILRVQLHFTGAGGMTAEGALENERLATGIEVANGILASVGINLVVGGYHDVPGTEEDPSLIDLEGTIGNPNDLSKLLLTGQGDEVTALNVFFVGSIYKDNDFAGGGLVLGIAAGVPGPAFLGPSYRSGVVLALFDPGEGEDYLGNVLAHEIGHYLGLYHSTESNPALHDTLSDTQENDGANLMFWAYSPSQKELSPHQGQVMRSHPFILPDTEVEADNDETP